MSSAGDITQLLAAVRAGDAEAESRLVSLVYDELRSLAHRYMRRERYDHTLQPTALVHETYLRLMRQPEIDLGDRVQFFATAAVVMRRILVDYARQRGAVKRAGDRQRVELVDFLAATAPNQEHWLVLDEALNRLAEWDRRQAKVVELMYFGGLTADEAAVALGVCSRTVKRDWKAARAWLQSQLSGTVG
jgi:RNA polymerase sigma factor (TIGR02999 family)